jgi:hypothetical protein
MYRSLFVGTLLAATLAMPVESAPRTEEFHAFLAGFNETGALNSETGAILSNGSGTLDLKLDLETQTITYTLKFENLGSAVTQSHIHFGKAHVPGGVMVFFCSNLATAPSGTQPCPANGGTITGTITGANVLALPGQNVTAGDFNAVASALLSDTAYVNVHTTNFPAGEIRGQLTREF